jgi:hypothetical protein
MSPSEAYFSGCRHRLRRIAGYSVRALPLALAAWFTDQLHMLPGRIEWRGVNLDLDYMKIANVANSFFK